MGIFSDAILNGNNMGAVGTSIDNTVKDKPNYGAISEAINNEVNAPQEGGFNWGAFGKSLLNNSQNISFGGNTQKPLVRFQPTMIQPQYVDTNFQNQVSNIAQNNLYNALMR